jgi:hypothetical protein
MGLIMSVMLTKDDGWAGKGADFTQFAGCSVWSAPCRNGARRSAHGARVELVGRGLTRFARLIGARNLLPSRSDPGSPEPGILNARSRRGPSADHERRARTPSTEQPRSLLIWGLGVEASGDRMRGWLRPRDVAGCFRTPIRRYADTPNAERRTPNADRPDDRRPRLPTATADPRPPTTDCLVVALE